MLMLRFFKRYWAGSPPPLLLIATGIKLLLPHRSRRMALVFATLAFAGIVVIKLPLLIVLLGLAPLSIVAAGLESAWAR